MPLYTYKCAACREVVELIVAISERDNDRMHDFCGGALVRSGIEAFRIGAPSYVPGAVTSKGQLIPGHFGKSARRKGGRYRP